MTIRTELTKYIKDGYGIDPDFPWERDDTSAVFRHKGSRKWFALMIRVRRDRLGLEDDGITDVINLRIKDPILHDDLIHKEGIFPAYHMNKRNWISVLMDGTVPEDDIKGLIDASCQATLVVKKGKNRSC